MQKVTWEGRRQGRAPAGKGAGREGRRHDAKKPDTDADGDGKPDTGDKPDAGDSGSPDAGAAEAQAIARDDPLDELGYSTSSATPPARAPKASRPPRASSRRRPAARRTA